MGYFREIPRDLFNEAILLKCLGKLWIQLDIINRSGVRLEMEDERGGFQVEQDPSSGSIFVCNVHFYVHDVPFDLTTPLNSREPWPLIIHLPDGEELPVFNDDASLSQSFLEFLNRERDDPIFQTVDL